MPETRTEWRPISRATGPVPNHFRGTRCRAGYPCSQTGTSTRCVPCPLARRCSRLASLSRTLRGQSARQAGSRLSLVVSHHCDQYGTCYGNLAGNAALTGLCCTWKLYWQRLGPRRSDVRSDGAFAGTGGTNAPASNLRLGRLGSCVEPTRRFWPAG